MNFPLPSYIGEISSKSSDLTEKQSSNYKKSVEKRGDWKKMEKTSKSTRISHKAINEVKSFNT